MNREFCAQFGRNSGGLLRTYHSEHAKTVVVALGSVNGTIQEVVDQMRMEGLSIGSVSICSYRPFPQEAVQEALEGAERVVVVEKSLAVGLGGILTADIQVATAGSVNELYTVIAGLGGRVITQASLREMFLKAEEDDLEPVTFLDLNWDIIERHLAGESQQRLSGPAAENILRDH